MKLNELRKLDETERLKFFAEFLRSNVLPSLQNNEEKLDKLYEKAKDINKGVNMANGKLELLNDNTIKTISKLMIDVNNTDNPMTIKQLKVILKIQNYTGHRFKGVPSKDSARDFISTHIKESYEKEKLNEN